ncbi:hypothetical protein SEVIR_8G139500v4 [Setaria viridis]|uniref:Peptidase S1 domain-containing protein n=1 Tax=Setaria viridis TaxID=4556 RepID=A0A4U6TJT5_SETVI|nr:hypothetical protein SEVIR_8G139500v2 [Setaria viridis]
MMHYCNEPHNSVLFSHRSAKALRCVVMLSWPISGHRTAILGHISHRGRTMPDISGDNPYGFTMRLTEVDITSESGSSGAPCFDGWGYSVGVLHGGDGRFSYFIPLNVVRQTLAQWGFVMYADE